MTQSHSSRASDRDALHAPDAVLSRLLAREFVAKPMHALFRSWDFAALHGARLDAGSPTLDFGCGDGSFGAVFCLSRGIARLDYGFDVRATSVRHARLRGAHGLVFRSDARSVPMGSASVRFVLCNGVLCCISPGHETALLEIARILTPGGQLLMTVPTPAFTDGLVPTRVLLRLGLRGLATRYVNAVNRRHGHQCLQGLSAWRAELERVGMQVEHHTHFLSPTQAAWWSILAMRPFQVFAVLRYVPQRLREWVARGLEWIIRRAPGSSPLRDGQGGYLLILARKR
jgi:SAM-dependent methyltransferase